MLLRHGRMLGLGVIVAAGPAFGQTPASTPPTGKPAADKPAKHITVAQATMKPVPAMAAAPPAQPGAPHTLAEALAATYSSQPTLLAERAKLRATDENVPQALSGWRPTVVMAGTAGYGDGMSRSFSSSAGHWINTQTDRVIGTAQTTLTQPLYNGGKTQASLNRAKNQVMAERANLINQEQTSFINAVIAYVGPAVPLSANQVQVGVIETQQLLALAINNEQVLAKQLQATNDRFRVGEITRTDVAQAEAALAQATAERQTAEGNLETARGTFQQVIGFLPPGDLVAPQPLALPVKTARDASIMAANNNPLVVAALFNDAAAKDAIDVAFSQLMPQVSFQGRCSSRTTRLRAAHRRTATRRSGSSRCRSIRAARSIPRCVRRGSLRSRPRSRWTMRAAPQCRTRCRRGSNWWPPEPRPTARGRRSAPMRSPSKAWSARPSSAAAPHSTC